MRRWVCGLAGLLLLAVSACSSREATPQAAPAVPTGSPVASLDYVALGDSYSAGPLIADQRADPSGCLRSTNNYPAYLAGYLRVASYRDVTCSGARTEHLTRPQTLFGGGTAPPQVAALSAGTDVVTLGIGGNDDSLFGSMVETCPGLRHTDPTGHPCRDHFTGARGVNSRYRIADRIGGPLGHALDRISALAPHASVYVIGYPQLLPTRGHCRAAGVASGDYAFMNEVERRLNRSLARAAARHHATYVSLTAASQGHDVCAGRQAWINGARLALGQAVPFHPFQAGERGMAQAIYRAITGATAPATRVARPPEAAAVVNPPAG